jgi:hypothetical protein
MQQGVTSNGVAFAIANLVPHASQSGIPYIAALPRIAAQPTADLAAAEAAKLRLCSGRYYGLLDSDGKFIGIETNGVDYVTNAKLYPHTNHYIFPKAIAWEGRPQMCEASEERRESAAQQLSALDKTELNEIFLAFMFHDGTSKSILQSGEGRETRTGVIYVINPRSRELYFVARPAEGVKPLRMAI